MKHAHRTLLIIGLLTLMGLIAGCGRSSLEVGMVETNLPGHWRASYTTFTGTKVETIRVEAGQTLTLDYAVEVDKGNLSIAFSNQEDDVLWDISLEENASDTVDLALEQEGLYTLTIKGDNAGGGFDLSWDLE